MADREKILRYFKAGGDEELAAKLLDLAEGARKSKKFRITDFLDPHSYNVAEIVAANYENIKIKWDKRFYTIGHRDVLGAFMGMGCKREILGDIVITPEGAHFVADKSFANYIESNLTQIGSAPVTITEIPRESLAQREEKVKIISATVADLRLDAVAAAGYGVSRSRMADEIKSLNVRVNWKEAKKPSQSVNEGDVISFRSRGRVEVAEIRGTTKKGRMSITLKRYI